MRRLLQRGDRGNVLLTRGVATDAGDVPHRVEDRKTRFVMRRGDDAVLVKRSGSVPLHGGSGKGKS